MEGESALRLSREARVLRLWSTMCLRLNIINSGNLTKRPARYGRYFNMDSLFDYGQVTLKRSFLHFPSATKNSALYALQKAAELRPLLEFSFWYNCHFISKVKPRKRSELIV